MNGIGYIGIFYVFLWNVFTFMAWLFSKEEKKIMLIAAIIVFFATVPTFLLGWFGSGN